MNIRATSGLERLAVLVLLAVILVRGYAVMTRLSLTWDEPAYLATGYAQLVTGNRELGITSNPPFMKYVIGLPFFLHRAPARLDAPSYFSGNDFFYGLDVLDHAGNDFSKIVLWGRSMVLLLSLVLAYFVYSWSRQLFGKLSGLLALVIYAFDPNIIAHSTLATTDIGVTVFIFLAVYYGWRFFKRRSLTDALCAGTFTAFSLGSKFTALVAIPVLFIVALMYKEPHPPEDALSKPVHHWAGLGLMYLVAFVVLWALYGFQLQPLTLPTIANLQMWSPEISAIAEDELPKYFSYLRGLPVPAASWVVGFVLQYLHANIGQPAFLFGNYSPFGWWYYYPLALVIKTPIPLLAMIVAGIWLFRGDKSERKDRAVILLVPIAIIMLSLFSKVNIGLRYILPLYPFLIVFSSQVARHCFVKKRFYNWFVPLASAWILVSSAATFPEYIGYFNEFVGGPENGHKYLLDSNLDWGQGLIQTKEYIVKHHLGAIKFSYFGNIKPEFYGIVQRTPSEQETQKPEKDLYFISANNLYDLYSPGHQGWLWARAMKPTDRIGYSIFVYDLR